MFKWTFREVRIGRYFLSYTVPVQNGRTYGKALSPLFFNFALKYKKAQANHKWLKLNGTNKHLAYAKVERIFQTSKIHLKILHATRVTWSKFHAEDPQTLSVIAQNSVAQATWRPGFLHSWSTLLMLIYCRKHICYKEHTETLAVTWPHICLEVNTART